MSSNLFVVCKITLMQHMAVVTGLASEILPAAAYSLSPLLSFKYKYHFFFLLLLFQFQLAYNLLIKLTAGSSLTRQASLRGINCHQIDSNPCVQRRSVSPCLPDNNGNNSKITGTVVSVASLNCC